MIKFATLAVASLVIARGHCPGAGRPYLGNRNRQDRRIADQFPDFS